jgi:hypothetical protein
MQGQNVVFTKVYHLPLIYYLLGTENGIYLWMHEQMLVVDTPL